MSDHPLEHDPFPPEEFDVWAEQYDQDVDQDGFPFTGYHQVLDEVYRLAEAGPGMSVLDLGTGTANLAKRFLMAGCTVWGTDFSAEMLERARAKLPAAQFYLHDLRQPFPLALNRRFDRIVSGYVFHHFELPEKVALVERLAREHLEPGGRIVIADISFPDRAALDAQRQAAGEQWEEEPYWIAGEALAAFDQIGLAVAYQQVSSCAGIYWLA